MHEGIRKGERLPNSEELVAKNLVALLREKTGQVLELADYDGTYEIDADTFFLTFTVGPDFLEIRSIEAKGEKGLGTVIVRAIQNSAAEKGLVVIVSNVLDTAVGFWQKMHFEPTGKDGEYIWEG